MAWYIWFMLFSVISYCWLLSSAQWCARAQVKTRAAGTPYTFHLLLFSLNSYCEPLKLLSRTGSFKFVLRPRRMIDAAEEPLRYLWGSFSGFCANVGILLHEQMTFSPIYNLIFVRGKCKQHVVVLLSGYVLSRFHHFPLSPWETDIIAKQPISWETVIAVSKKKSKQMCFVVIEIY